VSGGHEFTGRRNRVLRVQTGTRGRKREVEDEEEGARIRRCSRVPLARAVFLLEANVETTLGVFSFNALLDKTFVHPFVQRVHTEPIPVIF
jgi:hypothetical protein